MQTGFFSVAVAVLVSVSVQDLRPNPQNTSAFHLERIHQLLANPNTSLPTSSAAVQPPAFSPPSYAIWVNSLWFLSLAISLICAFLATLLQQCARRYARTTQLPSYSPLKRARIRTFFSGGVKHLHLPFAVEALPTLLHISLFLFFSGLLIYLFNIDLAVFIVLVCCVGLFAVVYSCITFMPLFRHDSPYYTPLSSSVWLFYAVISYAIHQFIETIAYFTPFVNATRKYFGDIEAPNRQLIRGMDQTIEEIASKPLPETDARILSWMFETLDDDNQREQFFDCIPGFFSSKSVEEPHRVLDELRHWMFADALSRFLDRSLTSNLLSEPVKTRRFVICLNAADATFPDIIRGFLHDILSGRWNGTLQSVEMGHHLRTWAINRDRETGLYTQCVVAGIIASVRERDGGWHALATDQLCVSRGVVQEYVAHGDSVLLANLIHVVRKILRTFEGDHYSAYISSRILPSVSHFDILQTLPGLQRDFCALWNEIVREARNAGSDSTPTYILREIRHNYIALHQGTDAAPTMFSASTADHDDILSHDSSYPLCNVAGHHTDT
jgi:hypothetical protein